MKKGILALLILFLVSGLYAQDDNLAGANNDFAPAGAKWYYSQTLLNPDYITYTYIESVKDTVINDTACKQLVEFRYDMSANERVFFKEFFMFNEASRVYYYSFDKNRFCLLYDFSKQAGEFWTLDEFTYSDEDGFDNRVYVDSVSNWIINGENRVVQFVHMEDQALCFGNDVIIEGIGNLNYMFPFCELSDIGPLRCYEDDFFGNYHVIEAEDCTHQYLSNEKYISNSDSYRIYPNPTKDFIKVNWSNIEFRNIKIVNLMNSIVFSEKNTVSGNTYNLSDLQVGVYFLIITSIEGDLLFAEKIIKY
ncbi:MAG: T9SS type A sorting domain-containing protein [Bacteroidales bacterium]|jgi:hypothetical protein|nr:T9SS type A sorting domain-containing protein [Bacteroidales bacterium]